MGALQCLDSSLHLGGAEESLELSGVATSGGAQGLVGGRWLLCAHYSLRGVQCDQLWGQSLLSPLPSRY